MSTRPITDTLRHIGGGVFIDTASEKMRELVDAVNTNPRAKGGKLELTITVKKASRMGAMNISGKVKLHKPAEEPLEALLFATDDGNLVADDPHQHKLPLQSVSNAAPTTLKTA